MKIVLAFDSFKGCMSASDACNAAEKGIRRVDASAEVVALPLSDGGEGLVNCLSKSPSIPLEEVRFMAHDPLMRLIEATYLVTTEGRTAYMEMAATSGLTLLSESERNPLKASTYGVGEMILDAYRRGVSRIVLGIGGSATCDAGKGMLEALGVPVDNPQKPKLEGLDIIVACDVNNPLYGLDGAAHVFAPQKGATPEQVKLLDEELRSFARLTERCGVASADMVDCPGAGAAGGLGYALLSYLDAKLQKGIEIVLDALSFNDSLATADCVLTGEGKSDSQTLMGKVPMGVLQRARQFGLPTILLSGAVENKEILQGAGFEKVMSINERDTRSLSVLLQREVAMLNLEMTVEKLFRTSVLN